MAVRCSVIPNEDRDNHYEIESRTESLNEQKIIAELELETFTSRHPSEEARTRGGEDGTTQDIEGSKPVDRHEGEGN